MYSRQKRKIGLLNMNRKHMLGLKHINGEARHTVHGMPIPPKSEMNFMLVNVGI